MLLTWSLWKLVYQASVPSWFCLNVVDIVMEKSKEGLMQKKILLLNIHLWITAYNDVIKGKAYEVEEFIRK